MGMMNRKEFAGHKLGMKVKPVLVTGPGLTKQEFRDETDVNVIMKRYGATGQLPVGVQSLQPIFADVSEIGDFASLMRRTKAAEVAFMNLPAELRTRFGNDPGELVVFLQNPANRPEAEELGLVPKREAAKPPVEEAKSPVVEPGKAPVKG